MSIKSIKPVKGKQVHEGKSTLAKEMTWCLRDIFLKQREFYKAEWNFKPVATYNIENGCEKS
jgi:hypothetical protein